MVETAIKGASAVFTGEVVGISDLGTKIKLDQIWKGEFTEKLAVIAGVEYISDHIAGGDSCKFKFRIGEKYLVFATKEEGKLKVHKCSRTNLIGNSERVLKMLEKLAGSAKQN